MNDELLTDEDIQRLHGNFNPETVKHALVDAEKRLQHELDVKKDLDEKAFWFLKFLVPVVTLLAGYILINFTDFKSLLGEANLWIASMTLLITFLILFLPIIFFILSLLNKKYGVLGRYPDTWLDENTIANSENYYITNLVYILTDYQSSIANSAHSNAKKALYITYGMVVMLAGFIIGFVILLIILFYFAI